MDLEIQGLVQVFLVLGGVAYVAWGVLTTDPFRIGLGALAVVIGLVGLVRDGRISLPGRTE